MDKNVVSRRKYISADDLYHMYDFAGLLISRHFMKGEKTMKVVVVKKMIFHNI